MTKERGRAAPPEQKAGGGRTAPAKKAKASSDAKVAQSAKPAASRVRPEGRPEGRLEKERPKDRRGEGSALAAEAPKSAGKSGAKPTRDEALSAFAADGPPPSSGKPPPRSGPVSKKSPVSSKRRAIPEMAPSDRRPEDLEAHRPSKPPPAMQASRESDPKGWVDALVERWVRKGQMLLQRLAQHGAADHEYRADLKDGRFVWIGPEGAVSAEASAAVLCSWSRSTSVLAMGWADPVVRYSSIDAIDGMPAEHDDVDEEKAWHLAMEAAELSGAEYLYRVPTPHAWYFLALSDLRFDPSLPSFRPGTPVGLVLRELASTREAIESRAEPADVIRERLSSFGSALLHQAEYAYRNTDWVARLERTGRTLAQLAGRLPRQSYAAIAAGQATDEWIERDLAVDLVQAIALLEDEWSLFT